MVMFNGLWKTLRVDSEIKIQLISSAGSMVMLVASGTAVVIEEENG